MSIDCSDCIDIIALYVDDLLIASSRTSELLAIKRRLTQQYEMEDMGEATFILASTSNVTEPSHHQHRPSPPTSTRCWPDTA